jgi:hypothetical protein
VWTANAAPGVTQPVEHLRRRDFVDQVQIDIKKSQFAAEIRYLVCISNLLK